MRNVRALLSFATLLLASGATAAGCLNGNNSAQGSDAGSITFDAGGESDAGVIEATDGAVLATATIDFGPVGCGTGSATRTYAFTNPGPGTITYSASVASGSPFAIASGASGSVAPGKRGAITLVASGIPAASSAGAPITATLALTTNVPGLTSVSVPLKATATGGSLVVTPSTVGFGQVQIAGGGATFPFQIQNTGNAPVTVDFGAPTVAEAGADYEFGLVYAGSPGPTTILPGGTAGAGATFAPSAPGAKSVTLAIQTNDPLCASSASAIAMSGTGTTAQVAVGPNPLQFGTVPCGQAGTSLQVAITNASSGAVGFTDSLGLGASSPFTIDVTSGTVPGASVDAGVAYITVTPKVIPVPGNIAPGAYDDTLVVTPTAPFVSPTTVTLQESASGAILAVTMDGGTDFGTVGGGQTGTLPFTVTNTGNVDAPLSVSVTGAGYGAAFTTAADAPPDGGPAQGNVTFSPTAGGSVPGSLRVSTTAALCATVPAISLSGSGQLPVASFPMTPIAAGATCGGTTTQGSLMITNAGGVALSISNAASTSGAFTVVSSPSPIPPGDSGTITIQPVAIGQGTAGGSTVSDTLSFTTNEPGNPTHSVGVAIAVSGANLAYVGAPGNTVSIDTPNCGTNLTYSVTNTGNMPAVVQATGSYPTDGDSVGDFDVFDFGGAFSTATTIAVGSPVPDTVRNAPLCLSTETCTRSTVQSYTSLDSSGTAVGICIPLPPLSLSVNICDCSGDC